MADDNIVNPKVYDAVTKSNLAVLGPVPQAGADGPGGGKGPTMPRAVARGAAYQAVAQAAAMAVQDATASLRAMTQLAGVAESVIMALMIENPDVNVPKYAPAVTAITAMVTSATTHLGDVGQQAGRVLTEVPSS